MSKDILGNETPNYLSPTYTQEFPNDWGVDPSLPKWPPDQDLWNKATADALKKIQRADKRARWLDIIQTTRKRLINQRKELHGLSKSHTRLLKEVEQLELAGDHLVEMITSLQDEVESLRKDNSRLRLVVKGYSVGKWLKQKLSNMF